jgi:hypothetical protein
MLEDGPEIASDENSDDDHAEDIPTGLSPQIQMTERARLWVAQGR